MTDPLFDFKQEFQHFIDTNPHLNNALLLNSIPEHNKAQIVIAPGSLFHKFKRDWVSKSYRKTIVERPERLLACSIGISAALTMYPSLFTIKSIPLFGDNVPSTAHLGNTKTPLHNSQSIAKLMAPHVLKVHGEEWPSKLVELCQESKIHLDKKEVEVPQEWNSGDIYLSPSTLDAVANSISALETGVDTIFANEYHEQQRSLQINKKKAQRTGSNTYKFNDIQRSSSSLSSSSSSSSTSSSSSSSSRATPLGDNHKDTDENLHSLPSPSRCFVMIRPPGHHCHIDFPEGFCLLNNVYIAAQYASDFYGVTHVAILDYDLHHGDGTQDLCFKRALSQNKELQEMEEQRESMEDPSSSSSEKNQNFANDHMYDDYLIDKFGLKIGYFSMHDINSFPTEVGYSTEENVAKASSCIMDSQNLNVWNVHLKKWGKSDNNINAEQAKDGLKDNLKDGLNAEQQNGGEDVDEDEDDFYRLYNARYRQLFSKADEFFHDAKQKMAEINKPFKGLVIISSGFDASEYESPSMQRHQVNVPTSFYNVFTKDALKLAQLHTQGKILSVLEGGYSDGALVSGMFSHLIGLQNQDWIKEWGSKQIIKELCKGCKHNWKPHKKYSSGSTKDLVKSWSEQVIRLGRSMIPEFKTEFFDKCLVNNMGLFNDPKELEQVLNELPAGHTRSRTKKLELQKEKDLELQKTKQQQQQQQPHIKQEREQPQKQIKQEREHQKVLKVPSRMTILNKKFSYDEGEEEDEEDEDYVYDEELNKTFNRTVEDITIDDISRHLETLEIIEPSGNDYSEYQGSRGSGSGSRRSARNARRSKPMPHSFMVDDNDYSLMDITLMSNHPQQPYSSSSSSSSSSRSAGAHHYTQQQSHNNYRSTRSGRQY